MDISRRGLFKLALAGGCLHSLSSAGFAAPALTQNEPLTTVTLDNGMRVHCYRNGSRYISAALILRSKEIGAHGGLAHILEHTSFTGAAGNMTASELKQKRRALIQDSNAMTSPGKLEWYASFLPKYASEALQLLAVTSLDQKFDLETVRSEARIVLEELLLDKYSSEGAIRRRFNSIIYGKDHPYGKDTLNSELAVARMPTRKLAEELRRYADMIRLPANMDLFLVGNVEPRQMCDLANEHFGKCPYASGPMLDLPRVGPIRTYRRISGVASNLSRPMGEIRIAWNTGVAIGDPDAHVLLALGEYLNELLFSELREKHGAAYSPEAGYEPDSCSGIFSIVITTRKPLGEVEKRVFSILDRIKDHIDPTELALYRDRWELKRLKLVESSESTLEALVARLVEGCALEDLAIERVSADDMVAAARKYLPKYKGGYVCVSLRGI